MNNYAYRILYFIEWYSQHIHGIQHWLHGCKNILVYDPFVFLSSFSRKTSAIIDVHLFEESGFAGLASTYKTRSNKWERQWNWKLIWAPPTSVCRPEHMLSACEHHNFTYKYLHGTCYTYSNVVAKFNYTTKIDIFFFDIYVNLSSEPRKLCA